MNVEMRACMRAGSHSLNEYESIICLCPNVAQHTAKALKLFIKHMLRDPNLYKAFKTPRVECSIAAEPLTLEEVRAVARAIEWPPAKAYFALLAETGLRPGEILNAKVQDLDLNERILKVMKANNTTKRSHIVFFSVRLRDYLRDEYLPYREEFVESIEPWVRNVKRDYASEWRSLLRIQLLEQRYTMQWIEL
jgi:integrase